MYVGTKGLTQVKVAFLSFFLIQSTIQAHVVPGAPAHKDDEVTSVIVKYKSSAAAAQTNGGVEMTNTSVNRLNSRAGISMEYARPMSGNSHLLQLPGAMKKQDLNQVMARILEDSNVEYVQPNVRVRPYVVPNDSLYAKQWHYYDSKTEIAGINAPTAWDITTGHKSIYVGVIDTGVRPEHADLNGVFAAGRNFVADPTTSDDPTDPGDFNLAGECGAGSPAQNSSWHGTHVSGTIGAKTNNSVGVSGVNWVSKIVPTRALGKCGGYLSDIIDAMRWSAGLTVSGIPNNPNPAKVLNLSLGGGAACSKAEQSAIDEIVAAGTTVVVAAGNSNMDTAGFTPASCNNVIAVGAVNRDGGRAGYSNFGDLVKISAPGGDTPLATRGILSTLNLGTTTAAGDGYAYYQGTSMATPHVAGVVSLMYSANPTITPAQVLTALQASARPFPVVATNGCLNPPYSGATIAQQKCGAGMLDATAAVGRVSRLLQASAPSLVYNVLSGTEQTLTFKNTNTLNVGLSITSTTLSGTDAILFRISSNACANTTVPAGGTCAIKVKLVGDATNPKVAALNLAGDFAYAPQAIPISASGVVGEGDGSGGDDSSGSGGAGSVSAVANNNGASLPLPTSANCFLLSLFKKSALEKDLDSFRYVRDEYLMKTMVGRAIVTGYYRFSDVAAPVIDRHEGLREGLKRVVAPIVELTVKLIERA